MSKKLLVIAVMLIVAAFVSANVMGADPAAPAKAAAKPEFVGKDKCKLCHKVEHDSWLTTVHAKAWDKLKPEEQKKDSCVVCHSSGKDAAGTLLTGVQCEGCHGPGSLYKSQSVMKDKKAALAAGLIEPTKETCIKCHNAKSPTFKGFEFEKAVKNETAIHKQAPKKTETKG
jgi:hypothetical protein